ncbi:hypothetical protein KR067_012222, partial [Drosophila pandora]
AVTSLLRSLEGGGCKIIAYADDVAIAFVGKYPQTLCDLMTGKLKVLSAWAQRNVLGVNPSKTELVLFTRKSKIPNLRLPQLLGESLVLSDSAKYLGITLDRKLDWKLNTADRTRKAAIALYTCRKAVGLKWGMSPKIVRWLYTAIIRPILFYGVVVWWPALDYSLCRDRFRKTQRMAEVCITGSLRTTPSDALDI